MTTTRRLNRLDITIWFANLILIGIFGAFYVFYYMPSGKQAESLVQTDPKTRTDITALEDQLRRNPNDQRPALTLAHLYERSGELPWSHSTLELAERQGGTDPSWRLQLALTHLEIGNNQEGLRIIREALKRCASTTCEVHARVKLEIIEQLAERFVKDNINARKDPKTAANVMNQILRPIDVKKELATKEHP